MMIDCDACAVRGPACGACVVTVLLGAPPARGAGSATDAGPDPGFDLDGHEQAALAVLAGSGLVPPLRLVPVDRSSDVARPAEPGTRAGSAPGGAAGRRSGTEPGTGRREPERPDGEGRAAV